MVILIAIFIVQKYYQEFIILYRTAENFGRKNFGEFCDLLRICQSFIHQLLVIPEKATEAGLKSAKVFFAKCNLACNSPKFSPAKIFHYTVGGESILLPV